MVNLTTLGGHSMLKRRGEKNRRGRLPQMGSTNGEGEVLRSPEWGSVNNWVQIVTLRPHMLEEDRPIADVTVSGAMRVQCVSCSCHTLSADYL